MPSLGIRLQSIMFKHHLKHAILNSARSINSNWVNVISRPGVSTSTANPTFVGGVATKDINLGSLSLRIFLPKTAKDYTLAAAYYSLQHDDRKNSRDGEKDNKTTLYVPGNFDCEKKLPIVLQFHGGAFVMGSKDSVANDTFCRKVAKSFKAIVVAVGYRLAPEHKFPAAFEDGVKALNWLAKQANLAECSKAMNTAYLVDDLHSELVDSFGGDYSVIEPWLAAHGDYSRCLLLGSCSGANIADHVSRVAMTTTNKCSIEPIKIVARIFMYPFLFGKCPTPSEIKMPRTYFYDMDSCILALKLFLPAEEFDLDHPAVNPLAAHTPVEVLRLPTLTVVAELDWMKDRAIAYSEMLRNSAGRTDGPVFQYRDCVHEFATLEGLLNSREAEACIEDMSIWVKKYLNTECTCC